MRKHLPRGTVIQGQKTPTPLSGREHLSKGTKPKKKGKTKMEEEGEKNN